MANIAVVGATGNVGREVLSIIGEMCFSNGKNGDDGDGFVVDKIFALASTSSSGKHVSMTLEKQVQVQAKLAAFALTRARCIALTRMSR